MLISIVMPYWNRGLQLDVTLASIAEQNYPGVEVVLIPDIRQRTQKWMNPAPLYNQGIERAQGKILILQNPECKHTPQTIEKLACVERDEAIFASCMALNPDGSEDRWYCHGEHRRQPWFFCGSLHKDTALKAGGFNESFTGYGGEDQDFAGRLQRAGCKFIWRDDIVTYHQWHEFTGGVGL